MDTAENNKKIEQILKLLEIAESNISKIRSMLREVESESNRDKYRDVPGVTGIYDGFSISTETGEKFEVPANYAAKSRLLVGDKLKLITEDGKQVFKQIEKTPRKKIEGILTKKEGKWYILSDAGSYKISDIAADFNKAQLNEEAVAFIPENDSAASFAALDYIKRKKDGAENTLAVNTSPKNPEFVKPAEKPVDVSGFKNRTEKIITNNSRGEVSPRPTNSKPKHESTDRTPIRKSKPFNTQNSDKPKNQGPRSPKPPKPKEFVEDIISLKDGQTGDISPSPKKDLDDDDLR